MAAVGKRARTKNWVAGQQIDSFSDLEGGGSDDDSDASSEDGALERLNGRDGEDGENGGRLDPAKDWESFEELARKSIATSRTSIRVAFLNDVLLRALKRNAFTPQQSSVIIKLLIPTYQTYVDTASRNSVQQCLALIIGNDLSKQSGKLSEATVKWLDNETTTRIASISHSAPPSTVVNILAWSATIFEAHAKALGFDAFQPSHTSWNPIVKSIAVSYDALQAAVTRKAVKMGGIVTVRRVVRKNAALIPHLLRSLSSPAHIQPATAAAPLLGLVVSVAIRLKHTKAIPDGQGKVWVQEEQAKILNFYRDSVVASRTPLPVQCTGALNDFVGLFVTEDDLKTESELVKAMDRALLRNPEISLTTLDVFFTAYVSPVSFDGQPVSRQPPQDLVKNKLFPHILTSAKSSNVLVRSSGALFLNTLVAPYFADTLHSNLLVLLAKEASTPLRTNKSVSPEHRAALCKVLAGLISPVPYHPEVLGEICEAIAASLAKESNEMALKTSLEVLSSALIPLLSHGDVIKAKPASAILIKGMSDTKPNIRRQYLYAVGTILWQSSLSGEPQAEASSDFAKNALPGLEAALKTASGTAVGTAVEGWIAVATLRGAIARQGIAEAAVERNPLLQNLLNATPKPSFLIAERGFKKIASIEDEVWLIRAVSTLLQSQADVTKAAQDTGASATAAQPLIYLAMESRSHEHRKDALRAIESLLGGAQAELLSGLFIEGLKAWLLQAEKQDLLAASTEEVIMPGRPSRLQALLMALARPAKTDATLLVNLVTLAHHPFLGSRSSYWVELALSASQDPAQVAVARAPEMLSQIWQYSQNENASLVEASYRAIATLTFVAPDVFLPILSDRVCDSLDPSALAFIGHAEIETYRTPAGSLYVDVLASNKASSSAAKGKNVALDKWDEETRKALEAKKKTTANAAVKLSKADQILVDAQLRKEADLRQRVSDALFRVLQAFKTTRSILESNSAAITAFVPKILSAVLAASKLPQAILYDEEAFQTVLRLYESCTSRVSDIRLSLALAVLRGSETVVVPDDFQAEDLATLTTRVLYRLRFQSEQQPFDASTFALASPLLGACIAAEGLGLTKGDTDAAMEQLALAVDVIAFHVKEFRDPAYPRLPTITSLISAVQRYPSLAQSASAALVDLGQAIEANALKEEISALLLGMMLDEAQVRHACLQALAPLDLTDLDYNDELWIVCQDIDERNAQLASDIWEENGLDVKENSSDSLLPYLAHKSSFVRSASARAVAKAVEQLPDQVGNVVENLARHFHEAAKERLPEYDKFGMLVEESLHQVDPWQTRVAHAEAFQHLAPFCGGKEVQRLFQVLIQEQALGDRSEVVRSRMLDAGVAVVDLQGKTNLQLLMAEFQGYLGSKTASTETADRVTESVIVLLGRLAQHLESDDARVGDVIDRLLVALKTPSEIVQVAVSDCLPALVKANNEKGAKVIEQLLRETLHAAKYAERRGAAYGLAGAIKGRGISAIKEFDIMTRLQDATEDKKNANARQGAVFAFETLSSTLGRLFEPYIVKSLPLLLTSLGDSSTDVRDATSDAAKVIMSRVSGHAVKLILPLLLDALQERQWRTKKGAIELMGAMAYLAPRQLSRSLPTIIPPLTEVLTDTHAQVRSSANISLKRFGEVVSNPEIQAMQSILLGALVDPTKKTAKALDTLLTTSFVHYIDTSSLALIVPIIDRGLRERSAEIKRKGAQIVGNMASLTDSKDLTPYLPQLIPRVREVLIDPVPEARATAAKSLGVLIERLGEDVFPTLVQDLMDTLKSDKSGVDQQGAAQGLSEVLSGLGVERMENMLPDIISNTSSPRAYVREGFISLLIYLPSVFGDRFSPYLGRIIQPVLSGLADDSEFVREASMRAGRMIVNNHSSKAIDLLLPELERGLFDVSWRIRFSSIQLVGELLFRISGISGKAEMEEEGNEEDEDTYTTNTEAAKKMLEVLGKERRDKVIASMYILRQDTAGQVRTFSITIWKALVNNTPRTVREMLPALMQITVRLLSSGGEEQREAAARTLGELCRKQGERILGDIIPILQKAAQGSEASRQGCCLAFAEMLEATTKNQLEGYEDDIIASVRTALVDESPVVRQAAAQAFDALQSQLGPRSIDQTIPTLLGALTQQDGARDAALAALKELMSVRAQAIFPILIPTLLASPISAFNARALASLVAVAGSSLNRRLSQILDALQSNKEIQKDDSIREDLDSAIRSVLSSVNDSDGLHMLMLHLLGLAKDPRYNKRIGGCELFASFCQLTEEDFSAYHTDWVRRILALYEDDQDQVVEAAVRAMEAFNKTLTKEEMEGLAPALKRTIEVAGSPSHPVAGFCRAGGLKPVLPILVQGLLAGTNEQREQSALGLGDIVERTATDSLKPYVTQITGPLIRIIAERYPAPVKAAILSTLAILLSRAPQFVRPFLPQLQRTFVKNLSDISSITVRNKAVAGLGILMSLQPRIDPLITELVNGAANEESEIRDSMANALAAVVKSGGPNMSPASCDAVAQLVQETLEEPKKDSFNSSVARVLAGLVMHNIPQASGIMATLLDSKATVMSSIAILECLENAPVQLYQLNASKVANRILKNVVNENSSIARPARDARELLKKTEPWSEDEDLQARLA